MFLASGAPEIDVWPIIWPYAATFGLIVLAVAVAFFWSLFNWIRDRRPTPEGFEVITDPGTMPDQEEKENDHG